MKLLIEFDAGTGKVIGAVPNGIAFVDLPGTSGSCIVNDELLSEQIWQSFVNGGKVTVKVDLQWNFISANIQTVEPPAAPPTLEEINAMLAFELAETQFRLQQVEQMQADLIFNLVSKGVL